MSVTVYHLPVVKVVLFGIHAQYFESVLGGHHKKTEMRPPNLIMDFHF